MSARTKVKARAKPTIRAEANTYKLPRGEPIRRALRAIFQVQRTQVLDWLAGGHVHAYAHKADEGDLPDGWPEFRLGNLAVSERMTPLVETLWDDAGRKLMGRVGLDPDRWEVTNPHTQGMIRQTALAFSASTNRTTRLALDQALERTREALTAGLVTRGESVAKLTKRVNEVFDSAEKWRARRIAQTEASRAVHAAQEEAARQSGIVAGFEWLLSSDACPLCHAVARLARRVRLGQAFAVIGDHPDYSQVRFPPLHPHCNCTTVEVLKSEESSVEWSQTAIQPVPSATDEAAAGTGAGEGAKPVSPVAVKPAPAPRKPAARRRKPVSAARIAAGLVIPIVAGATFALPALLSPAAIAAPGVAGAVEVIDLTTITGRLKAYSAGDAKVQALSRLPQAYRATLAELETEHQAALKALRKAQRAIMPGPGESVPELVEAETRFERVLAAKTQYATYELALPHLVTSAIAGQIGTPAALVVKVAAKHPAQAAIGSSVGFLESVLATDPAHPKGLRLNFTRLKGVAARDFYGEAGKKVWIGDASPVSSVLHETAHAIEHQWPGVGDQAREFLAYRTAGEKAEKLTDLFPGDRYAADEIARKDRFDRAFSERDAWYTGKDYRPKPTRLGAKITRWPTEVLAMGLQKLYTDPVGFATNDPEFCKFVLGILDGTFR